MSSSTGRTEMDFMWLAMGVMFIFDGVMFYIHAKMHKQVQSLQSQLNEIALNNLK
jgi:uncharacterized protein YjeT (DUF2065 family)